MVGAGDDDHQLISLCKVGSRSLSVRKPVWSALCWSARCQEVVDELGKEMTGRARPAMFPEEIIQFERRGNINITLTKRVIIQR
jgi:hypothetical protein